MRDNRERVEYLKTIDYCRQGLSSCAASLCNAQAQLEAKKKKEQLFKRFSPAGVGQTMMVPIPEFDQGHEDSPNVTAVEDGPHEFDTQHGVLQQMCSRRQIMPCTESFFSVADVPKDGEELSLQKVSRLNVSGQVSMHPGLKVCQMQVPQEQRQGQQQRSQLLDLC